MSIKIEDCSFSILNICRICLKRDRNFVSVFVSPLECQEFPISTLIHMLGNVTVIRDDGFPPQICFECEGTLVSFFKFRQKIESNYELLQLYVKNAQNESSKIELAENSLNSKTDEIEDEYDRDDDMFLADFKIEESNDYNSASDNGKPNIKSKTKKKKTRTGKKKDKRNGLKNKSITKTRTKQLPKQDSVVNKVYDELSSALQKRLENRDKCPLCFEKLQENETMSEHFYKHYNNSNLTPLIVNGKKTPMCNLCNKNYKFNSMIPHHRKHLKLYPFKCEIEGCNKAFASTMNLGWHLDNHNGVKKYQCQTCGKTFHLSGSLRNHEETHIIERAQCKICHKTYKNHIMLKLHMKRHIYGQRHKCEEPGCDKAFYSAQELRRHAHVHYGSKSFVCDVCSKPWYTEKDLIRHKKYHDPVKQHQCSECMKTFVDKSQLKCHEMTHRGERPHVCEYCHTGFITKSKLKRHQVKSCKGVKQYQIL